MKTKALKAAFPHSLPILAGFLFLGMSYGIYMSASGFSVIYPMVMSILIFGGSLEFMCVSMLLSPFSPLSVIIVSFLIQARHLFYGISMLEKFKGTGAKKFYLIFGMCDETFSINYTAVIPEGIDKGWFMFFVTLLNQLYWFAGSTLGGLIGSLFKFNAEGISFVMTALFVIIFLEQWLKEKHHISAYIGIGASVLCLIIFGPDAFLVPAMVLMAAALAIFRKPIEGMEIK